MSSTQLIGLFSGAGGAIAVLTVGWILILTEKLFTSGYVQSLRDQINEKNAAIATERDRADAERRRADVAVDAAQTSNILLASITGRSAKGAGTP